MKLKIISVTLVILFLITGCTTTQKLSKNNKQIIKKIYIDKDAKKDSEMYYYGPEMSVGGLFGVVGSVAASALKPGEKIKDVANKNDIFIEKIFLEKLSYELEKTNQYELSNSAEEADALIKTNIKVYGFSVVPGFSQKIVPYLVVKCEMYDTLGNKIWQAGDQASITSSSAVPFDPDDIFENPDLIRSAWEAASEEVSKNIISDL